MKSKILTTLALLNIMVFSIAYAQTSCESFDGIAVPNANKAHAFNIYGNGNAGFLEDWFVPSGTPSVYASGDFTGINAYNGNQFALVGVCNISLTWTDGLLLQYNFAQNQSYAISSMFRNMPIGSTQPTPIDVEIYLIQNIIPYVYNSSTGCSATPPIPAGSLLVGSVNNFNLNSWQFHSLNTGNLSGSYSYLWIRPKFAQGAPLITTALLMDSFCARQLLCNPSVNLGNDTSICPGQTVSLDARNPNATYLWSTGATTSSIIVNTPGTYSVTVTGECGPQDVAVDTIVISGDITPPTALCRDISIYLNGSASSITAADVDNGSSDNCSLSLSVTPSSFDCSHLGNNVVTLTASDGTNTADCAATVTVVDSTSPVALCRDIAVALSGSSASVAATDIDNGSSDNCSVSLSASASFDCSNLGANNILLTATDGSGNSSTCNAVVTVTDTTAPVALCQDITLNLTGSADTISAADVDGGSSDNCSATLSITPSVFGCGDEGANIVTLTATDGSGNASTCEAIVTVVGGGGSAFTCSITSVPASSSQLTGDGPNTIYIGYGPQSTTLASSVDVTDTYTYSWSPSADLSCADCASPVFTPTQEGMYTFTLTLTNAAGCSSTCSITICVLDIRVFGNCNTGNGNGGNSPGKVYVCHLPPGNPANVQTICIGVAGVPAHVPLHGGDHLGRCNQTCGFAKLGDEDVPELITDATGVGFDLLVYPNPSKDVFNIMVESESEEPVTLRVYDVVGQLITETRFQSPNRETSIGQEVVPGMYLLEITQGGASKVIRVTKAE